ncbi:acyl-CoA dehydrogenase family protein [Ruegeria sp.]|uniref:acyl-CoA dehydrogenase family protein n=1 Tax=Ruegeria sp. TaxID=1879320 RepID=UPI003B58C92F
MPEDTNIQEFRQQIRSWLDENCPADMRDGNHGDDKTCWGGKRWQFQSDSQRVWLERCAAKGLTVPTWPKAYGGAGLDRAREKVFREEMNRINARLPLQSFGIWMLGPAVLHFGTEDQKQSLLPPIARGEIRWCQGYSEPGAGSDLANVQTKAEDHGDHWLVNGQKIWTSYADQADWIFALVRTDGDVPKHKGISFVLIDMEQAGVTTRPIRLISGQSPFCETFFDNAVVPKAQIIGEENRGWDVAKYLLTHERENISELFAGGEGSLGQMLKEELGEITDPVLRADVMRAEIDSMAIKLTLERYRDQAEAGQGAGDASAMLKYVGTEFNKRQQEILMRAGGSAALEWDSDLGNRAADWLRSKGNSIEGGTSEVMLGIISRRILGLPG